MKNIACWGLIVILCCCLTGCGNRPGADNSGTGVTGADITLTPTAVPTSEPERTTTHRLTWALYFWRPMTPEADNQKKINDYLYEQGYDCTIDFVYMDLVDNAENERWLQEYVSEHGGAPDVLCVGTWGDQSGPAHFAEKYFLPLDEYLNSSEGKLLYESFAPVEWEACRIFGNTYTIPWMPGAEQFNRGVYLHINQKYADYFSTYDGTYQSLHDIYEAIGDSRLCIKYADEDSLLPTRFLFGAMGYQCHGSSIPYDPIRRQFVDFSEEIYRERLKSTFELIFNDFKEGILVSPVLSQDRDDAEVLAYIDCGIASPPDGYSRLVMAEDSYSVLLGGSYGVSRESANKELALKVIAACYSNPEIAVLLCPHMETAEKWVERKELMKGEQATDLTGLVIELPWESKKAYDLYRQAVMKISNDDGMFKYNQAQDSWSLKSSFQYESWSGRDIFESDSVKVMIAEYNRQLAEYNAAKE